MRQVIAIVLCFLSGLSMAVVGTVSLRHDFVVNTPAGTPETDNIYLTGDTKEFCEWRPNCILLKKIGVGTYSAHLDLPTSLKTAKLKVTRGTMKQIAANGKGEADGEYGVSFKEGDTTVISVVNWTDSGPLGVTGNVEYYKNFHSPQLGNDRNIAVWLPPSYTTAKNKRYPVIYMHDGQNVFDPKSSMWWVDWSVDEAMTRLIKQGAIPEAIVVAMDCTKDRELEYDYAKRGPLYADFVINSVKKMIDTKYRTLPGRESTSLMGASMGALISVTMLWYHPETFGRAAGLSFAVAHENGSTFKVMEQHAVPAQSIRIYVDSGNYGFDADYEKGISDFYRFIRAKGFPEESLAAVTYPFADHNEAAWARRVHIPLKFLLAD